MPASCGREVESIEGILDIVPAVVGGGDEEEEEREEEEGGRGRKGGARAVHRQ